ncbi:MAG: glycosyltransferase [Planctomycetota bacterium]|jgi:glycosyltransferase involved in cell wall biosynthesis
MKTSIAIPCAWHHIRYLDSALSRIAAGTELADEVVIVISPVGKHQQLHDLNRMWHKFRKYFHLKIEFCEHPLDILSARHALTKNLTGDVVLYHDADDTQHPQRVEIVKRFFNEHDIVHLCHSYRTFNEGEAGQIRYDDIKVTPSYKLHERFFVRGEIPKAFVYGRARIHSGASCIRRDVLEKVSWGDIIPGVGEDAVFCFKVLELFNKTILIDAPLLNYNTSPERRMDIQATENVCLESRIQ